MPVVVKFPPNPTNAFEFGLEPKAKAVPPKEKLVVALTTPPCSSPLAVMFPVPVPLAVMLPVTASFPVKVLAPVVAKGEQVKGKPLNALPDAQALEATAS